MNRLQQDLADRIIQLVQTENWAVGDRLSEHRLAKALKVSRTPIRAALSHLAELGAAHWTAGSGFTLAQPPQAIAQMAKPTVVDEEDALLAAIAADRLDERIAEQVSEADLMRRYRIHRPLLLRVLTKLSEAGLVERNPGYGWRFLEAPKGRAAGVESYRFRLLLEPAALLEPNFNLEQSWIDQMRMAHRATMNNPWVEGASVAFFEMNAAFHEGLAAGSGNRFILASIQQQNRLRRFHNYDWTYGLDRVIVSCTEHLEILNQIEQGDLEVASLLLRRHLSGASKITRR